MARRGAIMQRALGLDYEQFEREGGVAFDYEGLVGSPAYDLDAVRRIQAAFKVGNTPLWELPRLSQLVRQTAPRGPAPACPRRPPARTRPARRPPASPRSPG